MNLYHIINHHALKGTSCTLRHNYMYIKNLIEAVNPLTACTDLQLYIYVPYAKFLAKTNSILCNYAGVYIRMYSLYIVCWCLYVIWNRHTTIVRWALWPIIGRVGLHSNMATITHCSSFFRLNIVIYVISMCRGILPAGREGGLYNTSYIYNCIKYYIFATSWYNI